MSEPIPTGEATHVDLTGVRIPGALPFDRAAAAALGAELRGDVVLPGDPGYDDARRVWNAMIDRRPAVVARCRGVADVRAALAFARADGLPVAIRGGGHNVAGNAVCDRGVVIDLSPMRGVRVDRALRTARVEGGCTLADVDRETQLFGLATPLGINSTTGVAGLTLGGGFGWLSRGLGLTIDNLRSADVVLASGEVLTASAQENADLFWALRGGGGNFGVVTSFELDLHPVGPQVLAGLVVHPLDAAHRVLRFYRDLLAGAPERLSCWFVLRQAPPLPFLPAEWHGREILALAMCWAGDAGEGHGVLRPLRELGSPLADVVGMQPYTAWQTVLDPLLGPGMRNYWKSHDFRTLPDALIDVLVDYARMIPDPQCEIAMALLGGAVARVDPASTAYRHRDAEFVMNVHGRWADPAKDDACIAWARELSDAAAPYSTGGVYVNFLTSEEGDRVPAAYGQNYARLVAVKDRYDPANVFRANQNVAPSART